MKQQILWSFTLLPLLVTGCVQNNSQTALKKELAATNTQVAKMSKEISSLESTVSSLKTDEFWRKFFSETSEIAYLTPGSSDYSVIKLDEGYITVALANVRPYANGSKVTLRFGNPMDANITGVKMKLEWGTTNAAGQPDNANEKSRDVTLLKSLAAGSWTEETFALGSIPASKLGFVRVTNISHQGMSLRRTY